MAHAERKILESFSHIKDGGIAFTELTKILYNKTCVGKESEVHKGWASGPFSEQEVIEILGPLFVPCRRFGVTQGKDKDGNPKVRPIDDFSEFFHNSCVATRDKVAVDGIDSIANFIKLWGWNFALRKTPQLGFKDDTLRWDRP